MSRRKVQLIISTRVFGRQILFIIFKIMNVKLSIDLEIGYLVNMLNFENIWSEFQTQNKSECEFLNPS